MQEAVLLATLQPFVHANSSMDLQTSGQLLVASGWRLSSLAYQLHLRQQRTIRRPPKLAAQ